MKINIYTSYYAKMAQRKKQVNDYYIQVSWSAYCPRLHDAIDESWADLFAPTVDNLCDYEASLEKKAVDEFANYLKEDNWEFTDEELATGEFNIFLLCFENLEKKYTKQDEVKAIEKGCTDIKAGEFKKCHRTILAEILNRDYGFNIQEYK